MPQSTFRTIVLINYYNRNNSFFLGSELANETHLGGLAESAAHRATDLAGDAECPGDRAISFPHGNQNRLGFDAAREREGEFDGLALDLASADRVGDWGGSVRCDPVTMETPIGLNTASASGQAGEFRGGRKPLGRETKWIRGRDFDGRKAHEQNRKGLESTSVASAWAIFPRTVAELRL